METRVAVLLFLFTAKKENSGRNTITLIKSACIRNSPVASCIPASTPSQVDWINWTLLNGIPSTLTDWTYLIHFNSIQFRLINNALLKPNRNRIEPIGFHQILCNQVGCCIKSRSQNATQWIWFVQGKHWALFQFFLWVLRFLRLAFFRCCSDLLGGEGGRW